MYDILARKAHLTKRGAKDAIENFLEEIKKALSKGEKVVLSGFGTFKVVSVKDKSVVVPGTRERRTVKGHRAARFTPGKALRKAVK